MHKKHVVADSNESHFSLAPSGHVDDQVLVAHKKLVQENPNYVSHWKIGGVSEVPEPTFMPGRRMGSADASASHFSFGGETVSGDCEQQFHPGKKMASTIQSEVEAGAVPLPVFERPSSRVLV